MESLIVYPENPEHLRLIQEFLTQLEVPFDILEQPALPPHVLESVKLSMEQFEKGQTISLEEFRAKHL